MDKICLYFFRQNCSNGSALSAAIIAAQNRAHIATDGLSNPSRDQKFYKGERTVNPIAVKPGQIVSHPPITLEPQRSGMMTMLTTRRFATQSVSEAVCSAPLAPSRHNLVDRFVLIVWMLWLTTLSLPKKQKRLAETWREQFYSVRDYPSGRERGF